MFSGARTWPGAAMRKVTRKMAARRTDMFTAVIARRFAERTDAAISPLNCAGYSPSVASSGGFSCSRGTAILSTTSPHLSMAEP